jgi:hypothetical protein
MKAAYLLTLTVAANFTALADFSYTTTTKGSGSGPMAAAMNRTTKHYLKGQKMKMDSGETAIIFDFDAQTFTSINNTNKTYKVTPFSELGQAAKGLDADVSVDVKETGQKKDINGYPCREVIMTIAVDMQSGRGQGMKVQMEMDTWISSDVPGAGEVRAFYQRNGSKFPWSAMTGGPGGNSSMQKAIADMQRKMTDLGGIMVLQIMRVKMPGMQMTPDQQAKMAQSQAKLDQLKQTNPQAYEMAQKAMAGRMGGGAGGGGMEATTESSGFSSAGVPDSVFAIPAGYTKQ